MDPNGLGAATTVDDNVDDPLLCAAYPAWLSSSVGCCEPSVVQNSASLTSSSASTSSASSTNLSGAPPPPPSSLLLLLDDCNAGGGGGSEDLDFELSSLSYSPFSDDNTCISTGWDENDAPSDAWTRSGLGGGALAEQTAFGPSTMKFQQRTRPGMVPTLADLSAQRSCSSSSAFAASAASSAVKNRRSPTFRQLSIYCAAERRMCTVLCWLVRQLLNAEFRSLSLAAIFERFQKSNPECCAAHKHWRSTIRHCLCSTSAFVRVLTPNPRSPLLVVNESGLWWAVEPTFAAACGAAALASGPGRHRCPPTQPKCFSPATDAVGTAFAFRRTNLALVGPAELAQQSADAANLKAPRAGQKRRLQPQKSVVAPAPTLLPPHLEQGPYFGI